MYVVLMAISCDKIYFIQSGRMEYSYVSGFNQGYDVVVSLIAPLIPAEVKGTENTDPFSTFHLFMYFFHPGFFMR